MRGFDGLMPYREAMLMLAGGICALMLVIGGAITLAVTIGEDFWNAATDGGSTEYRRDLLLQTVLAPGFGLAGALLARRRAPLGIVIAGLGALALLLAVVRGWSSFSGLWITAAGLSAGLLLIAGVGLRRVQS